MHSLFVFDSRDIYGLYYDKGGRYYVRYSLVSYNTN